MKRPLLLPNSLTTARTDSQATRARRRRRGTILITVLWVIIVLSALVLVFARSMRVEVVASANRVGAQQAASIQEGAEQYALSLVDQALGDPANIATAPAEALPVGNGYFWLIRPAESTNLQTYIYGLVD